MKKIIAFALAALMALSLCACVSQEDFDAEVSRHQEEISRLESELQTLRDQNARQEESLKSHMEKNTELENKLNDYSWVIGALENEEYEHITYRVKELQREKELAEMEAKGILEIEITLDNWDQYFEYIPYGYSYIKNSFGETTHINLCNALRLKDGYVLAEDSDTRVAFEFSLQWEKRECTVDFTTNEVIFGEIISARENTLNPTTTATFTRTQSGVCSFGTITQLNNNQGNAYTEEVDISGIKDVIRVQGTLYIYGN